MPSFSLRSPDSGACCGIELGRGLTCLIEASTPEGLEALLGQLLGIPGSQVAHGAGGMVNNINVLENIALPVIYHGVAPGADIEPLVFEAFGACGLDEARVEALCRKRPGELDPFEQRLAGFVRGLLMRPDLLIYSRFFEGLTHAQMERAAALDAIYRMRHPEGTSVYLSLSDMPGLRPPSDRKFVM